MVIWKRTHDASKRYEISAIKIKTVEQYDVLATWLIRLRKLGFLLGLP